MEILLGRDAFALKCVVCGKNENTAIVRLWKVPICLHCATEAMLADKRIEAAVVASVKGQSVAEEAAGFRHISEILPAVIRRP